MIQTDCSSVSYREIMTAKNKVREQVAVALLTTSTLMLLAGWITTSGWKLFLFFTGGFLFATGTVMYLAVSVINGVPWFVRLLSESAEPTWEGDILHGHGGAFKIRYVLDKHGWAHFVADDICSAAGTNPPLKNALKWGGVQLTLYGDIRCFSESSVLDYLAPLAAKDFEANRLLVLIRNHQRRLEKQRNEKLDATR